MEGHASATKRDLAALWKELEQQKEKTVAAMQDTQTSRNATEQLYNNYQDLKTKKKRKNLLKMMNFLNNKLRSNPLSLV